MAVDVLEEAEYYQVTGLVDWCKMQDLVISKEILALVEREEQLPACQLLKHEVLAKLAKQSVEGKRSSLLENGVNGSLVGKVGVVFIAQKFKVGEESFPLVEHCSGERPFDCSKGFAWIGQRPDHHCYVKSWAPVPVSLAIYSNDVTNPVVYVQRAMQRFNKVNPGVQLALHKFSNGTNAITQQTACGWSANACTKEVYYFIFKFLFRATSTPAGSNPEISSIRQILEKLTFCGESLRVYS